MTIISFIKNNKLIEKKYIERNFRENINLIFKEKNYKKIIDIIQNYTREHLSGVEIAYCGLKSIGKPAHYSEITDACNRLLTPRVFTAREIHSYLTRNDLFDNSPFVWVGMKGIYALKEWGYESGTVADVIAKILQEEGPISKKGIVEKVLAQRDVKVGTISLNLQKSQAFVRVGRAVYAFDESKWTPEPLGRGRKKVEES